jgi:signal transduction histidine kinase
MGMTAADIEHLFERFFRTESAHANLIQGVGLGLPIVKAIGDAHDGTISVASEPNHGTSYAISLPLSAALERNNPAARQEPQLVG